MADETKPKMTEGFTTRNLLPFINPDEVVRNQTFFHFIFPHEDFLSFRLF